jgi:hypothetical protein
VYKGKKTVFKDKPLSRIERGQAFGTRFGQSKMQSAKTINLKNNK